MQVSPPARLVQAIFPDGTFTDTADSNPLDCGRDRGTALPAQQNYYCSNCATNAATLGL